MIDNPEQVERLLTRLQAALPVPARMTPELAATLRTPETATEIPAACSVTALHYAGDEGGIVCRLDAATATGNAVYASITHLRFDPRLPAARDIAAYQKHRAKRLRRQAEPQEIQSRPRASCRAKCPVRPPRRLRLGRHRCRLHRRGDGALISAFG